MANLRTRFTTIKNRLHLRQNWPLWTAAIAVLFTLLCLAYSQNVPHYPDYSRSPVIYPFLIFSSSIFLLIPLILLASLFLVGTWCVGRRRRILIFGVAFVANWAACHVCVTTGLDGYSITQKQSLAFNGHVYQLAQLNEAHAFDSPTTRLVVYECDAIGVSCPAIYLSSSNYADGILSYDNARMETISLADGSASMIYLRVVKDILYVKTFGNGNLSVPTTLSPMPDITTDNANKVVEVAKLIRGSTSQLAWSPDGKTLAIGGRFPYLEQYDQPTVWFYDLNKLQAEPQLLQMDTQGVPGLSAENIVFSPDGRTLAATGWDSTVHLWDVASSKQIGELTGDGNTVSFVAFSPDGKLLASDSSYHQVWLWDVETKSIRSILSDEENHSSGLSSVAFSPNGKLLASAGGVLHIWDLQTDKIVTTIPLPGEYPSVNTVAFSPDGKVLAYGGSIQLLKLWDVEKGEEAGSFRIPGEYVSINSLSFSPDGTLLATGSSDGIVRIWDVSTQTQLAAPEGHEDMVQSVAFSPDGKLLASTSHDGTVRVLAAF